MDKKTTISEKKKQYGRISGGVKMVTGVVKPTYVGQLLVRHHRVSFRWKKR